MASAHELDVLVLAAGRSERLRALLGDLPKPLIEIEGEPVLVRNLRWLASFGLRRIWINLHFRPEAILSRLGSGGEMGLELHYSYERELLGTAGAARALSGLWGKQLLVIYGDSLLRFDLSRMLAASRDPEAAWIAVFSPARHPHTGISGSRLEVDQDFRVRGFEETRNRETSPATWVAAGAHLLPSSWVSSLPDTYPADFGQDVFPAWLAAGRRLFAHPIDGYCLGLDTPATYAEAHDLIRSQALHLS